MPAGADSGRQAALRVDGSAADCLPDSAPEQQFLAAARAAGTSGYVFKRNAGRDLIPALEQTLRGEQVFPEPSDDANHVPD
jgi:hypothetical protein